MNIRQARKIRKAWKDTYEQRRRYNTYLFEVGSEGESFRSALSMVLSTDPSSHSYSTGWWPKGRVLHHLQIRCRSMHSQSQVTRAYRRISLPERLEWAMDMSLLRSALERETYRKEHGEMALLLRDSQKMIGVVGMVGKCISVTEPGELVPA